MSKGHALFIRVARGLSGRAADGGSLANPIDPSDWRISIGLFVLFLSCYGLLVPYTTTNWPLTGDEPHYLAIAASIAEDGDLDLANNSANCALDPHVQILESGEWRPAHMVGLPVLLAVPYAVAGRTGAALAMALISALTVALTYLLAMQVAGRRDTALVSAIALGVTPPFSVYTAKIYPEMPGAFLLVFSLVVLFQARDRIGHYLLAGLAAASMPWLVIRFAPLSVVVALLIVARAVDGHRWARNTTAAVLPCVISAALYIAYNVYMYGSWSPLASYGSTSVVSGGGPVLIIKWATSLLGWLLDQRGGVFIFAPVFMFSIGGLAHLLSRRGIARAPLIISLAVGVLFGIVLPGYWVQWSPPTRYLVVVLPLLALGIGQVATMTRSRVVQVALVMATVLSVGISATQFARPWLSYNMPFTDSVLYDALPDFGPVSPTSLLPLFQSSKTFKDRRYSGPLGTRTPGSVELYFPGLEGVAAGGGRVERDPAASQGYATRFGSDEASSTGYLLASVSQNASVGQYRVRVRLRSDATWPDSSASSEITVSLDTVAGDPASTLAVLELAEDELSPDYQAFELVHYIDKPQALSARVSYAGTALVWVDSITVVHTPPIWRSWGLTLAWAALVGLLAVYTCRTMRDRQLEARPQPLFPVLYGSACAAVLIVYLLVFGRPLKAATWRMDAEAMRRQIGDIRLDATAQNFVAVRTRDSGFLVYGPYVCVAPGSYIASFRMRVQDTGPDGAVVGTVQATAGGGTALLATLDVAPLGAELVEYEDVRIGFYLAQEAALELRLLTTGLADVWLDYVQFELVHSDAVH